MEVSNQYSASTAAVPSPDTSHIACIHGTILQLRSTFSFEIVRSIQLPETKTGPYSIRWSPSTASTKSHRILVHDGESIRVYDLRDVKWKCIMNVGSAGTGNFAYVDFGISSDDVLAFFDFASKVTLWSLATGRSVEIKDPKYPNPRSYGFRPRTGELALLSRPSAQDMATLHDPKTHELRKPVDLASTDAQGLKWSPDGHWLMVWDTPTMGSRVYIYTADGHLYRMYGGDHEHDFEGLGVRSVEWSPRGDYVAISGYSKRVTLLSTRTFSPSVYLEHTSSIQLPLGEVWQEQVIGTGERTYEAVVQPVAPPTATVATEKSSLSHGISILAFNADGTLIATKEEATPTAVWIWDLTKLTPCTVILTHSPVRTFSWHPTRPDLLMVQTIDDEPILHLWQQQQPLVLRVPFRKGAGRCECKWLHTDTNRKPAIICSGSGGYLMVWPDGKDAILRFDDPESPNGADEEEDSLFDILTGRTPVPAAPSTTVRLEEEANSEYTEALDDTFGHKRGPQDSFTESEFF